MADVTCRSIRESLIDAGGGEIPRAALDHLDSCRDCAAFAAILASLATDAGAATSAPDYNAADLALARAEVILRKRKRTEEFAMFLTGAIAFSAAIATAGASGFGLPVLVLQGLAFLTLPFVGFAVLRKRSRGGAAWTA